MSEDGTTETVYQLRVVLTGISPLIWRRLQVVGSTTLTGLHEILQTAFGWDGDDLHEFTVHAVPYGTTASRDRDEDHVRLADLGLRERERYGYAYNFFAGWHHDLRVEKIGPAQPRRRYPHCLAGARQAPPDGCDAWSSAGSSPTPQQAVVHQQRHRAPPSEGKIYCCAVLNVYFRRIVG